MSIKKVIIVVLTTVIVVSGIFIASYKFSSKSSQPPKILLSEEEWDFGLVKPEEKPIHIFTIKNEGDEELILERIWVSCGCIKTSISTKRILPGKSAELKAIFDTTGYEGKVSKDIYIKSNDPQETQKNITLYVEVEHISKPMISLTEDEWDLGLVAQGDTPTFSFIIKNEGDADLIINKVETYEHIKHNIDIPLNIIPGEDYEVNTTYNSTEHNLGEIREAMRIFCNVPGKESLFLRIKGYIGEAVSPSLSVSPLSLNLSLIDDSEEGTIGRFTLENLGEDSVKITSIKSSVNYLTPLQSEFTLKSKEKKDLQVVLLKDRVEEEVREKDGEEIEEYIYLTIALPIEISK